MGAPGRGCFVAVQFIVLGLLAKKRGAINCAATGICGYARRNKLRGYEVLFARCCQLLLERLIAPPISPPKARNRGALAAAISHKTKKSNGTSNA